MPRFSADGADLYYEVHDRPTLLVSAEDSPRALHRINAALAEALPDAELVL
jgi:hypothetical protein